MDACTYTANKILSDYKIDSLPVKCSQVEEMIKNLGYNIVPFNLNDTGTIAVLTKYNIIDMAKKHNAITYNTNKYKIVFYKNSLGLSEKRFVLAHELGHIVLNHTSGCQVLGFNSSRQPDKTQEWEADKFATALFAPTCILKKAKITEPEAISDHTLISEQDACLLSMAVKRQFIFSDIEDKLCKQFGGYIRRNAAKSYKKTFSMFSFLAICIILITCLMVFVSRSPSLTDSTPAPKPIQHSTIESNATVENVDNATEIVVVTRTGDKYHLPDCQHVRGKDDVIEMTKQEAIEKGYEPCKVCKP